MPIEIEVFHNLPCQIIFMNTKYIPLTNVHFYLSYVILTGFK